MPAHPRHIDILPGSCFVSGMGAKDDERLVTLAVVQALRRLGLRVAAMTPVAADAIRQAGGWTSPHLEHLGRAGSFGLPGPALSPYVLPAAATPVQAAQQAGLRVEAEAIVETYQVLSTWADAIVVEGVGGLCVPLGPSLAVHDVARRLSLPLVIALHADEDAPRRAQCALSLAEANGTQVVAWVATNVTREAAHVLPLLAECLGTPALGTLPGHARTADHAADCLDLQALQQALAVPGRARSRATRTRH